ncbi:MAG: hypothetical protein ACI3Z5_03595 [Paludibacteraceae bacterium]
MFLAKPAYAEYYNVMTGKAHHYLGVSVGGGEANNLSGKPLVAHQAGGAANLRLNYEVQWRNWIFGLGVEAQYQYLRDTVAQFMDTEMRVDIDGEQVEYGYGYTSYHEHSHNMNVAVPVYFGYNFKHGIYALTGATFSIPLYSEYNTMAQMFTQGDYGWDIEPVRSEGNNDFSVLGYYPEQSYSQRAHYSDFMRVAAMLEIGAWLPVEAKKTKIRMGLYGMYGFRLGTSQQLDLADYSAIDKNPFTQTQSNLQQNIRWNPLNQSKTYITLPGNLEVGLRLTLLFDVTVQKSICRCAE